MPQVWADLADHATVQRIGALLIVTRPDSSSDPAELRALRAPIAVSLRDRRTIPALRLRGAWLVCHRRRWSAARDCGVDQTSALTAVHQYHFEARFFHGVIWTLGHTIEPLFNLFDANNTEQHEISGIYLAGRTLL